MEIYYFIQQKGVKKGPFKLIEIKTEKINSDDLVWRSDDDKWKSANEFDELKNIYITQPPLTPFEIKKNDIKKNFLEKTIPNIISVYFILFLIITFSSFILTNSSWEKTTKSYITNTDEVGKSSFDVKLQEIVSDRASLEEDTQKLRELRDRWKKASVDERIGIDYLISNAQIDSTYLSYKISDAGFDRSYGSNSTQQVVQPTYKIPEEIIAMENINGIQQSFLFRPFYAYFSKIYLTREEQNSSGKLFFNISFSTFSILLIGLIINLSTLYLIKNSD